MLDVVKLKYWSFIPRQGSGRRTEREIDPEAAPRAIERGRDGEALTRGRARGPLRRAAPRGDRGHAGRRRRAARRAGGRRGDVRRQPQRQLHQHLRRRLRVLRLRPGQALARRLPRDARRLPGADRRGGRVRRDRDLHAGRHPPGLHARGLRALAAPREGRRAAAPPARVLADGGPLHVRALGPQPRRGVRLPARVRPRLDPRHRGRGPRRRRPRPDLAQQAPGRPLGGDHRGLPPLRPALDLDRDVRPHRGALGARPPHAGRPRAAGAHGRDHRVRPALASSPSRPCSGAPTGSRRSRARRTSSTPPPSASPSAARSRTSRRAG